MSSQYHKISVAFTHFVTFANKEHAVPKRGISWSDTDKYSFWTSLLKSSAIVSVSGVHRASVSQTNNSERRCCLRSEGNALILRGDIVVLVAVGFQVCNVL